MIEETRVSPPSAVCANLSQRECPWLEMFPFQETGHHFGARPFRANAKILDGASLRLRIHLIMTRSSRRILSSMAHKVGSALPQQVLLRVEKLAAALQGKGVGMGSCDSEVEQCANLLSAPPRVLLDVGGNRGDYSAAVRARFPHCEIHIFEPAPECATDLRRRFSGDAHIAVHEVALSNETGEGTLWTDKPGSLLASLTRRKLEHFGLSMDQSRAVQTSRLDELASACSLECVDWMKIDVEGHELAVLDGASTSLASVSLVQFEFGGCNIDTRTFFRDYWYLFSGLGFRLYRLAPWRPVLIEHYDEILEHFRTTNYVAVRSIHP